MSRRGLAIVGALGVACGPPAIVSDGGALQFVEVDVRTSTSPYAPALEPIEVDGVSYARPPVLRGTAICPSELSVITTADVDREALADCFRASGDGLADDGVCLNLNKAGEAAWVFTAPAACDLPDDVPDEDRFTFDVIGPADVAARIDHWPEWVLEAPDLEGALVGDERARLPGADEALLVLADQPVGLDVELITRAGPTLPVAYRVTDAVWMLDDAPPLTAAPWPVITLGAGEEAMLRMEVAGATFDVGRVRGVAAEDVRDLAVSVGTFQGAPVGARAVGLTDDDEPVFGLPVTWEVVRGTAAIEPQLYAGQDGYALVSDACVPPTKRGGKRALGVRATWGRRSDVVVVKWDGVAGTAEEDATWEAAESCEGGCGCASTSGAAGGALVSMASLLLLVARRRPGATA